MKEKIKSLLRSFGVYQYLKYSRLFAQYEKYFKPGVMRQHEKEVRFYRSFLASCPLIFDIGANDGHKAAAFLEIAGKVVCCEPDAVNFGILRVRFRKHRQRVFLENIALGAHEGTAVMHQHHEASAFNTLNEKFRSIAEQDQLQKWSEKIKFEKRVEVKTNTLDNLIKKYGVPYFIKIDVEGYELEVLKGLTVPVPYMSMECLLPDFREELQQSFDLLLQLDPQAIFNIAMHEELLFKHFKSYTETTDFLSQFKENHFELVVSMKM